MIRRWGPVMIIGVNALLPCHQRKVASRKPQLRPDHGTLTAGVHCGDGLIRGVTRECRNTEDQRLSRR